MKTLPYALLSPITLATMTNMHTHGTPSHKILTLAILFTLGFALIELISGLWAGSLTLLSDAGHMAADSLALSIAAFAAWIAKKPATDKHSYGLARAEVVAAWLSSLLLLALAIVIMIESIHRFSSTEPIKSGAVILVALTGLGVNTFIAWLLGHAEHTINTRAAMMHVLSDILGSVAALISGAIIYFTHWLPIDPILSIFIALLIIISALRLLKETLRVLMQAVPSHINMTELKQTITHVAGVESIHSIHLWTLSTGKLTLTAHIKINALGHWPNILRTINDLLKNTYHIHHITLQPGTNDIPPNNIKPKSQHKPS